MLTLPRYPDPPKAYSQDAQRAFVRSLSAFSLQVVSQAASGLTYTPPGTGAVATTVAAALGYQVVSVFNWMTATQIADVQARTLSQDVTAAIQAAINAMVEFSYPLGGWVLYFPYGTYKITASLVIPTNAEQFRLTGSWGSRLQMSGSSFDLITFGVLGTGILNTCDGMIDNLGLDGGSIAGSGNLINTQYAQSIQFCNLLLTNLCTTGNGINVIGNGATYSHDIAIDNIYYNTTTGNAIVYMGATSSDSRIHKVKGNGQFSTKYGIYMATGSAHCHVVSCHPYGHSLNNLYVGANASSHWFLDVRAENGLQDSAQLNGTTNCTFTDCAFTYAPSTYADLLLINSNNNKFVNTTFTATPSTSKWAVNETGTSNGNVFNGITTEGAFTQNPPYVLVGSTSALRASGTDATLQGAVAITAGATVYIGNFAAGLPLVYGGLATQLLIECDTAPGAGQTFTAQVMINGVASGIGAVITGAASFATQAIEVVPVAAQASVSIRVVASAGAASSNIRACLVINQ